MRHLILLTVMFLGASLYSADWEFKKSDGGLISGTFKSGPALVMIQVKGELAVPGSELFSHIYRSTADTDNAFIRSFTLMGVHEGSLIVEMVSQKGRQQATGESSRVTLYYEIRDGEAGIPILGGGAPPQILYVKAMAKDSTYKTRLVAHIPPTE